MLDIEDYMAATLQIAQTTLRSVLGKAELDTLLSERERLNEDLQQIIDEQTEPWGIKVTTVEIKDVEIPERMQQAIARQAEAERKRRAKVINAEGEFQAADRLADAADVISPNPVTLQLRYLQTLTEISSNAGLDDRVPAADRPAQAAARRATVTATRRQRATPGRDAPGTSPGRCRRADNLGCVTVTQPATRMLDNYVGGPWTPAGVVRALDVTNPATGEVLARVPLSRLGRPRRRRARRPRGAARRGATVSVIERARRLFALREGLDARREELARSVTTEMGKTIVDARAEVARMIEMVEAACAIPTTMQGRILEDVSRNIDAETIRQPVGVCAAIVPFNFPAMVPFWFLPFAIACGNTFILKPSEQVPLTQQIAFEVLDALGLPPGVVNLVNGGREVVEGILDHPGIDAVSFVGSAPVARHRLRARRQGRQARAGARRRQEPHGRDARRRDRQDRRRASSARPSARPASAAWPARSSSTVGEAHERLLPRADARPPRRCASATAWTSDRRRPGRSPSAARERIRGVDRARRRRGRASCVVDGRDAGRRPDGSLRRPDDPRRRDAGDGRSRARRSSARCCRSSTSTRSTRRSRS